MEIIRIFIFISIAVVLFSSITITHAAPSLKGCTEHDECPSSSACLFHACRNICNYHPARPGHTCTVENHTAKFQCLPGHEHPRGGDDTVCLPISWSCYSDGGSAKTGFICTTIPK